MQRTGIPAILTVAAPACPPAARSGPHLPRQASSGSADRDAKRLTGKFGVRCAMLPNRQSEATSFLSRLQEEFPDDPDILFLAVHMYSDLAYRNSLQLMQAAPDLKAVLRLNAENFEKAGDAQKAIGEYHALLRPAGKPEDARKEFEEELKIDPRAILSRRGGASGR